jgi:hypothetical protein
VKRKEREEKKVIKNGLNAQKRGRKQRKRERDNNKSVEGSNRKII